MSENQRPRGYSFDGYLRPANILAAEAEVYHHSRVLRVPSARGDQGSLPRPKVFPFRQELYDSLVPNPILQSHTVSTSHTIPATDSQPHYSPHRQQDLASRPVSQFLKYMRLFATPNTLIPNCKQCLYKTHEYRALHDVSFPTGPPPTESYKLVMYASPIPRGAVNRIQFRSRSPTLPGISMTQLLHYQTVGAEHDEEDFPYFEEHPRIRLVCPACGYVGIQSDIVTTCSHGAITKIGLAFAIAYSYNILLQHGRRLNPNVKLGPLSSASRDYRLVEVYALPQGQGQYLWYAHVALTSYDGQFR